MRRPLLLLFVSLLVIGSSYVDGLANEVRELAESDIKDEPKENDSPKTTALIVNKQVTLKVAEEKVAFEVKWGALTKYTSASMQIGGCEVKISGSSTRDGDLYCIKPSSEPKCITDGVPNVLKVTNSMAELSWTNVSKSIPCSTKFEPIKTDEGNYAINVTLVSVEDAPNGFSIVANAPVWKEKSKVVSEGSSNGLYIGLGIAGVVVLILLSVGATGGFLWWKRRSERQNVEGGTAHGKHSRKVVVSSKKEIDAKTASEKVPSAGMYKGLPPWKPPVEGAPSPSADPVASPAVSPAPSPAPAMMPAVS